MLQKAGYKIQPVVLVISWPTYQSHFFKIIKSLLSAFCLHYSFREKRDFVSGGAAAGVTGKYFLIIFSENAQTKT